jgi:hypothetical protein
MSASQSRNEVASKPKLNTPHSNPPLTKKNREEENVALVISCIDSKQNLKALTLLKIGGN